MKVFLTSIAVGVLCAVSSEAHAADLDDILAPRHQAYESPQNFAFELRFGQYRPDIDGDPNFHGATPYQTTFGTKPRWMPGFEFDWQALRIPHFGSLGPAVGVAGSTMSAYAPLAADPSKLSAEKTYLSMLPMYAVAVLRVDALWRDLKIPLVPYGKLGMGMALWASGDSVNGVFQEKGHTFGYHAALGLAFNLNVLDPLTAKNMDTSSGVNNSYLFGEICDFGLDGLGDPHALRLNDLTWSAGLTFEL